MTTTPSTKGDKRLTRALEYVSDYWLPVNHEVARKIRDGLTSGKFESDRFLLKKEVCSDIALFFGCIRELTHILAERNEDLHMSHDFTRVFDDLDLETLQVALESVLTTPSVHLVSEGEDPEVGRLLEAVISMTAAQTLAPAYNQSAGAATSAAALRQLGFALIAWNYPGVYKDCIRRLPDYPGASLESLITSSLGFSPMLLATGLASRWGLPTELLEQIDDSDSNEDGETISAIGSTLQQICKVSEALARVQFERWYPSAKSDWDSATKEVERVLGPQGIERIRERCAIACASFLATSPDIFRPGLFLDEAMLRRAPKVSINPYIALSEEPVQRAITKLYEIIDLPRSSSKALQFLLRELIPAAKFTGGCVFTVDPTSCQLTPQLDVGLCEARTIAPVHYMVNGEQEDPVLLAFLTSEGCKPILVEDNRNGICSISAAFGRGQRVGVLYLEIPITEVQRDQAHTLAHFQGAVHALVDCLKL
jgi:hypothetical protein